MALSTRPELTPLVVKPEPVTLTPEIVTFEFPVFVSVTVKELLDPSVTFPNAKVLGLALSDCVAATPVPVSEIVTGDVAPLFTRDIEPVALPALVGENTALNVVVAPTAIVTGAVSPVMLKPVPVELA